MEFNGRNKGVWDSLISSIFFNLKFKIFNATKNDSIENYPRIEKKSLKNVVCNR